MPNTKLLGTFADTANNDVVSTVGNQSIAGTKTFTNQIAVGSGANADYTGSVFNGNLRSYCRSANGSVIVGGVCAAGEQVSMSSAVQLFTVSVSGSFAWLVTVQLGGGQGSILAMDYSSATIVSIINNASVSLTDSGTALRVYKSANSALFTVKNATGSAQIPTVQVIGAQIASLSNLT